MRSALSPGGSRLSPGTSMRSAPAEVLAGQRSVVVDDVLRRALRDDAPAVLAGAEAQVEHMVGREDRILVVLHDQHRVAQVAQVPAGSSSRRSLSRWCRPIDGSSSTYITPVRPEPICDASRMRCDSPPDSESADRSSDR